MTHTSQPTLSKPTHKYCAEHTIPAMTDREEALALEPLNLLETHAHIQTALLLQKFKHPINRFYHRIQHARAKRYLDRLNVDRIHSYLAASQTQLLPQKVIQLSKLVKKLRPKIIFEFGAGGSTILFAELLEKYNIDGKIYSFEQNSDYYDRISKAVPESLKDKVELHLCPVTYERKNGFRCLSYNLPEGLPTAIDFAYIDGPDPQHLPKNIVFFNGNLCDLAEKGIKTKFAINDNRWFNHYLYRTQLGKHYRLKEAVQYKSFLIEDRSIFPSSWSLKRFFQ